MVISQPLQLHFKQQVGLSNKTADLAHPAKPTRPEPTTAQPDYLAVGGRSLPSQTNSGGSDGRSSLPKPDPPNLTMYITQFLVILYSPPVQTITSSLTLSFSVHLLSQSHLRVSHSTANTIASQHHRRSESLDLWTSTIVELRISFIAPLPICK